MLTMILGDGIASPIMTIFLLVWVLENVLINMHECVHVSIYMYICMYMYMCTKHSQCLLSKDVFDFPVEKLVLPIFYL